MEVYKVVKKEVGSDKFESCLVSGGIAVEYKVGEIVTPTYGKIFTFDSLKNAKGFQVTCESRLRDIRIWYKGAKQCTYHTFLAQGKKSRYQRKWIANLEFGTYTVISVKNFWSPDRHKDIYNQPLYGTVFCDNLMLIKGV